MSLDESRIWALKAEALLLPTPLVHLDPQGERERERDVRQRLRLGQPSHDENLLLQEIRAHATDVQRGYDQTPGHEPPAQMKHPLGGDGLPVPAQHARQAWEALLSGVRPIGSAEGWKALYLAFADVKYFHQIPHNPALPDHSVFAHRSLAAALLGARANGDAALLLVQVGPVQPYIEASRRTRDLWAGSYMMSYMAAQAVKAIVDSLGPEALLSPRVDTLPLMRTLVFGVGQDPFEVLQPALPAKVLALVPNRIADELGRECLTAIECVWRGLAEKARAEVAELLKPSAPPNGWDISFDHQLTVYLERAYTVQPWPAQLEKLKDYLKEVVPEGALFSAPAPQTLGATYGALSGALWSLHSASTHTTLRPKHMGDYRPKCTQCGVREQMGPMDPKGHHDFWTELGQRKDKSKSLDFKRGEALCAVCLVKRLGVVPYLVDRLNIDEEAVSAYPSIPSIACAHMRRRMLDVQEDKLPDHIDTEKRSELQRAVDAWETSARELSACKDLPHPAGNALPGVGALERPKEREKCGVLHFDGAWFDEDAYEPLRAWREQTGSPPKGEEYERFCERLLRARGPWLEVQRLLGKPTHYVAALYMDGDELSKWLNGTHDKTPTYGDQRPPTYDRQTDLDTRKRPIFPALQGDISARLSQLAAREVAAIVHGHLGRLVYCGGDDVVALLPLETALICADRLVQKIQSPELLGDRLTLSAGLAIQHQREPLARLISGARKAEGEAKRAGRDRLVVHLTPRSGDLVKVELPWSFAASARPKTETEPKSKAPTERSVDALLNLLGVDDKDDESPLNLKLGYRLREELPSLGQHRELIEERLLSLAGGDSHKRHDAVRTALRLPLALLQSSCKEESAKQNMLNLLLLARFLRRERLEPM